MLCFAIPRQNKAWTALHDMVFNEKTKQFCTYYKINYANVPVQVLQRKHSFNKGVPTGDACTSSGTFAIFKETLRLRKKYYKEKIAIIDDYQSFIVVSFLFFVD